MNKLHLNEVKPFKKKVLVRFLLVFLESRWFHLTKIKAFSF